MSVHCERCGQASYLPHLVKGLESRLEDTLRYCKPHMKEMWAASVVGYLLDCDFRDAEAGLNFWLEDRDKENLE